MCYPNSKSFQMLEGAIETKPYFWYSIMVLPGIALKFFRFYEPMEILHFIAVDSHETFITYALFYVFA